MTKNITIKTDETSTTITLNFNSFFEITQPTIVSSNSKKTEFLSLIEKNSLLIFSYIPYRYTLTSKNKRTKLKYKKNFFYGLLSIINIYTATEEEVKHFLKKADSFSNRIKNKNALINTLYFIDVSDETPEYYERIQYLIEQYESFIKLKYVKEETVKKKNILYSSEEYDYLKFSLDTLVGEFYFSGVKREGLILEEELISYLNNNTIIKA